jgi:hypothetical protein
MGKAKTASKNNPTTREKAREIFYKEKKVKPVRVIMEKNNFMGVQYEDGSLAVDRDGMPLPWSRIKK